MGAVSGAEFVLGGPNSPPEKGYFVYFGFSPYFLLSPNIPAPKTVLSAPKLKRPAEGLVYFFGYAVVTEGDVAVVVGGPCISPKLVTYFFYTFYASFYYFFIENTGKVDYFGFYDPNNDVFFSYFFVSLLELISFFA